MTKYGRRTWLDVASQSIQCNEVGRKLKQIIYSLPLDTGLSPNSLWHTAQAGPRTPVLASSAAECEARACECPHTWSWARPHTPPQTWWHTPGQAPCGTGSPGQSWGVRVYYVDTDSHLPPALLPLGKFAVQEGHLDTCLTCHLATATRALVHHPPLVIALSLPSKIAVS